VSRYHKGKTSLDLLDQEIVSGSGIIWAICKSAPRPLQTDNHATTQFFADRMPFLPPNRQHQSINQSINQSITFNEHVTNVHAFNLYENI